MGRKSSPRQLMAYAHGYAQTAKKLSRQTPTDNAPAHFLASEAGGMAEMALHHVFMAHPELMENPHPLWPRKPSDTEQ